MPTTAYRGPAFNLIEERAAGSLTPQETEAHDRPLLVKGAVRAWPAWTRWSFDRLAELRYPNGKEPVCRFQQGLVEQGTTQPLPLLPVPPYLHELSRAAQNPVSEDVGLLPESRRKSLAAGEPFFLNWQHMRSFQPNRRYLADWPVL